MSWRKVDPALADLCGGSIQFAGVSALYVGRPPVAPHEHHALNPVQKDTVSRQLLEAIRAGIIIVPSSTAEDDAIRAACADRMQRLAAMERGE